MLPADEKEKLERGFAEGEASQLLEGLKLGEPYWTVKARILAGEITSSRGLRKSPLPSASGYRRPMTLFRTIRIATPAQTSSSISRTSVTRKRWIDLKLKSHPQALRIFQ